MSAHFSGFVCRRDGFYLELIQEMPDIEEVVVAEEQRSESTVSGYPSSHASMYAMASEAEQRRRTGVMPRTESERSLGDVPVGSGVLRVFPGHAASLCHGMQPCTMCQSARLMFGECNLQCGKQSRRRRGRSQLPAWRLHWEARTWRRQQTLWIP